MPTAAAWARMNDVPSALGATQSVNSSSTLSNAHTAFSPAIQATARRLGAGRAASHPSSAAQGRKNTPHRRSSISGNASRLASGPAAQADAGVKALREAGYAHTAVIGRITAQGEALEPVLLRV